jgi:hypothetical protein
VRSGLALTSWLPSTVPANLFVLDERHGFPPLADFAIHLDSLSSAPNSAVADMAHTRQGL